MNTKVTMFLIGSLILIVGCRVGGDGDDADRLTDQPQAVSGAVIPTPEPGTAVLLVLGAGALWAGTKQRPWRW